jgi:two-component system sensor histidine kinase UhpB
MVQATTLPNEFERQLTTLRPGDHICSIYENQNDRMAVAVPFLREGLARGECCLYLAEKLAAEELSSALAGAGIDVALEQSRQGLRHFTPGEDFLQSGEFSPQAMIEMLREIDSAALRDGFSGVRVIGEMAWAKRHRVDSQRLIEYEALLNQFLERCDATMMICQYHRPQFDSVVMHELLRTHPAAILENQVCMNPFYESPEMILGMASAAEQVDWQMAQLKRVRTALNVRDERSKLLRALVEVTTDALFAKDRNGRYLTINSAGARILGKSVEEVIDKNDAELLAPESARRIMEGDRWIMATGEAQTRADVVDVAGVAKTILSTRIPFRDQRRKVAGIVGFAREIRDDQRTQQALRESVDSQRVFSRRIIEIQEEDRRRLARELHDEIGQVLSAVSVDLRALKEVGDAAARLRLEESTRIVDAAIGQIRNLALDLRPDMLDQLGLVPTLRWYADRQSQRAGFVLHFDAVSSEERLPADLETACYRIVQETLTNIIRHAQARNVWLELGKEGQQWRLVVRDDGIGFDASAQKRRAVSEAGFGIRGMRERVELLAGTFEIKSNPGRGTSIEVRIPQGSEARNT